MNGGVPRNSIVAKESIAGPLWSKCFILMPPKAPPYTHTSKIKIILYDNTVHGVCQTQPIYDYCICFAEKLGFYISKNKDH